MPDSEVTTDYMLDRLVIAGTPSQVVDELLAFREEIGASGRSSTAGSTGSTRGSPGARSS